MITDNGKYYLYRHIRLDSGQPFYVGIGTKPKYYAKYSVEYKRAFTSYKRSSYWHKVVNKVGYCVEVILESDDYTFIKDREVYFIDLYKRTGDGGTLVNLTTGGDGTHGFSRTPEINKVIADKLRGTNNTKSKKCYQYNFEGCLVEEWDSFNIAATAIGAKKQNILQAKDKGTACKGFYWSDVKYTNFIKESALYNYRVENVSNNHYNRAVIAYNDEGTTLNFKSIVDAAEHFTGNKDKKSNIKFALSGKYEKAYGYKFKYVEPR